MPERCLQLRRVGKPSGRRRTCPRSTLPRRHRGCERRLGLPKASDRLTQKNCRVLQSDPGAAKEPISQRVFAPPGCVGQQRSLGNQVSRDQAEGARPCLSYRSELKAFVLTIRSAPATCTLATAFAERPAEPWRRPQAHSP